MDGYGWHALGLVAATLVVNFFVGWSLRLWRNAEHKQRLQDAEKVLRAHDMHAHVYLSSFVRDPGDLRNALEVCDSSNRLVLDAQGNVVGRVLPTVQAQGPGLRLVVDNTKPKA